MKTLFKKLLGNGEIEKVFDLLKKSCRFKREDYNVLTLYLAKYNKLQQDYYGRELISHNKYLKQLNKITVKLIWFIDKLSIENYSKKINKSLRVKEEKDCQDTFFLIVELLHMQHEVIVCTQDIPLFLFKKNLEYLLEANYGYNFSVGNGQRLTTTLQDENGCELDEDLTFKENRIPDKSRLQLIAYFIG